jgi:hypothetical protein
MRVEPLDPRDARIAELERLLAAALARIAELEAMRGINSRNSSKPPSTDGFRRATPPKQNTGKKAGGQPGHTQHHCGCPILADVVGVLETFGAWLFSQKNFGRRARLPSSSTLRSGCWPSLLGQARTWHCVETAHRRRNQGLNGYKQANYI